MSRQGRRGAGRSPRRRSGVSGWRPIVEPMERRQLLATIRVTSLVDALSPPLGEVTLRSAIESINAGASLDASVSANVTGMYGVDDRIIFEDLAGTITLIASLPTLSVPVEIDGRTGDGFAELPVITVDGDEVANNTFIVTGADVAIRSLAIGGSRGPGVLITGAGATGTSLTGNHIGVDASGLVALPNNGGGVVIEAGASGAVIGGSTASPFAPGTVGNVIAGNLGDQIRLDGVAGVVVSGNFIGTDRAGLVALRDELLGVDGHGVHIINGSGHVIGGDVLNEGNLISGNGINGIEVTGSSGNLIGANRIGTAVDGIAPLRNEFLGIRLQGGSSNNTIGGSNASPFVLSAGNLIANNGGDGIRIIGPTTTGNLVIGNFVGVDVTGTLARENLDTGIELNNAPNNTIGGLTANVGNLISGNRGDGILINNPGAVGNVVRGNRIGTNAAGTAAIPNQEDGVEVNGGVGNTIGGAEAGAGNLISGNGSDGIELERTSNENVVQGNLIGTNLDGTLAIPNVENGIRLDAGFATINGTSQYVGASNNIIGGVNAAAGVRTAGNLVSGNGQNGILLYGGATTGNSVLGNFVGTTATGSNNLGNTAHGILLQGATGNVIGGENIGLQAGTLRAGNLVSGNGGDGIRLTSLLDGQGQVLGLGSSNVVLGNFVGTNANGNNVVGNAGSGIALIGGLSGGVGPTDNTIGGTNPSATGLTRGNLISGNAQLGLLIRGEGTTDNLAVGNFIGTNANGTSALANGRSPTSAGPINVSTGHGVLIDQGADGNTIGAGNLVSGNIHSGIVLDGVSGILITGSRIGTNAGGTGAIGNGIGVPLPNGATDPTEADGNGILLRNGATGNTIGGNNADPLILSAGNLISGNQADGVAIHGETSTGNLIAGNRIGTNLAGTEALGNELDGVEIAGAVGNTIGGATPGLRNLISGNGSDGVELERGATGNAVLGNRIGTNLAGTEAIGNGDVGIFIFDASNNTVGGNLISGNFDGVRIQDSLLTANIPTTGNVVVGNFIGTDASGENAIGNRDDGVQIVASSGNTIGGTDPGEANLISGNTSYGVVIGGDGREASGNQILGNLIGTNAAGSAAIGNGFDGVLLASGATGNVIGGANGPDGAREAGNLISGNGGSGVRILGPGAGSNSIIGNLIGTDASGLAPLGNAADGVHVFNSSANAIGEGNVISGNLGAGIVLSGAGSVGNGVAGNFIGLGLDGETALGNGSDGIRVDGSSENVIAGNVVSSNGGAGVVLIGQGATGNAILFNRIGTDDAGLLARGNLNGGVRVLNAGGNAIGGLVPGEGNIVSGNNGTGIVLQGNGASGNLIAGNVVGLDATGAGLLGNALHGIALLDGASGNTIGGQEVAAGNLVSGNGADGVVIAGGSNGNVVLGNVIGANVDGTLARGNGGTGIRISDSSGNTIGGRANLISGNGVFGLTIAGASASGNIVSGNLIGVNLAGTASLGVQQVGLVILNAPNNEVEGGNLIAGHLGDGVQIIGAGATGNVFDGNLIGTDEAGRAGLGNQRGILIDGGASENALRANVISGNRGDGVVILNGSTGNTLAANRIGLAGANGGVTRGNTSGVLIVGAPGNTLDSNILSGNQGFGVAIAGTSGNVLTGNLIGVNGEGNAARPNTLNGVMILAATGNTLTGNVISANRLHGVELRNGANDNVLIENLIGTDRTGNVALGNASDGVHVDSAAGNRLERNVLSGNMNNGVLMISNSPNNVLIGNFLGTNREGTAAVGNRGSGAVIAGPSNVGMLGNIASGNLGFGIAIAGGAGNVVSESFIGTDRTGTEAIGNGLVGVLLLNSQDGSILNSVISGNGRNDGRGNVRIDGPGATGNLVSGNLIGTDATGSRSLDPRNGSVQTGLPTTPGDGSPGASDRRTFDPRNDGIVIAGGASGNTIGGLGDGLGNLISGNRIGLYIRGESGGNVVVGNRIGTNLEGSSAVPNSEGVIIMNSSNNTIGGIGGAARNLISGNLEVGIRITSIAFDEPKAPATGNLVQGNFIGSDVTGNAALPNRQGIYIYGASGNTIGGGSFSDPNGGGNLISGNTEVGIQILNADTINAVTVFTPEGPSIVPYGPAVGSVTTGNVVVGNRIGTNASGTARLSNFQGVFVSDAPGNTVIDNLISGNTQIGLNITAFNAVNNVVGGNRIGPDVDGNTGTVGNGFGDPNGLGSGLFLNQVVDGANTIASTNDIRGNSGAQTRFRPISAGPFVEGVVPIFDPVSGALTRIDVRINGYLSRNAARTLNLSNFSIAPASGGSGVAIGSVTYDEVARMLSITPAAPLPAGQSYRLTLVGQAPGGLQSRPGPGIAPAFLDGSGRAGTNFTRVINVPALAAVAAQRAGSPSPGGVDALFGSGDWA